MTTPTDPPTLPDPMPEPPTAADPGHGIGLEPTPPPRPWWQRRPALITAGVVLALVVCVPLAAVVAPRLPTVEPSSTPSASAPRPPTASPFDRAAWEAFVASGSVPANVADLIESVTWNGISLVAQTSIVNDGDAALSVCSALSAFWLAQGGFRPVQVVGADGGPLASRALEGQPCSLA